MESMKCQMEAGPMPPKVVKTHGRKVRPRAAEPEADALCYTTFRQTPPPQEECAHPTGPELPLSQQGLAPLALAAATAYARCARAPSSRTSLH